MPDYVNAAEAAAHLGCSEAHIRRLISRGRLPAEKVDHKWAILRADLDGVASPDGASDRPSVNQSDAPSDRPTGGRSVSASDRPSVNQSDAPSDRPSDWRADLLAQVARLEADKVDALARSDDAVARLDEVRHEATRRETEAGLREERSKARIIDLEREATVRLCRMDDMQAEHSVEVGELRGQVSALEAKVREVLEDGKGEAVRLADRIADLVVSQQDMHARVIELQPVADRVPMLVAAVEEKDANLSEMHADIDAIASRPVTGPVFRLLTKGKLRR